MPAEEANIVYKCQSMNNSPVIRVNLIWNQNWINATS
jgi:hypothetical protein